MIKISYYCLFLIFLFINQGFSQDSVTVTSPNGGERWVADSTHTITWFDNFDPQVKIELYKSGVFYSLIKSSTISNGVYVWSLDKGIPSDSDYTVKISSTINSNVFDFSDSTFTIIANKITVISPNGSENWKAGTTQTIAWTDNFNGDVWINLYKGPSLHRIIVNPTPSDGSFDWSIPFDETGGSDYSIRIASVNNSSVVFDNSDANFTITPNEITVTSPNGGEMWRTFIPQTITWGDNLTGSVKIELYQGGTKSGDRHSELANSIPSGTGSFVWNVSTDVVPSNDYLIKITSNLNQNVFDFSDTTFTFIKEITVLSPNGGENWQVGTTETIGWTDNIKENVSIDLYKSDTLYSIIEFATGSDGSKNWDIPDTIAAGSDYKIKLTSVDDAAVFDFSDNNFTIVPFSITVTSPNGGEQWLIGSKRDIVWTDNIAENVKIDLYQGGSFHSTIDFSSSSVDGVQPWDIPLSLLPGDNYKIRIESVNDSTLFDFSDNDFTLFLPKINITAPNGGEIWQAGTKHSITWTDIISEPVLIDLYKSDTLYSQISPSTPSDGSFTWSIPAETEAGSDYKIMIKSTANDILVDFSDGNFTVKTVPDNDVLLQNYPNPFNPSTTIRYGISEDSRVLLEVFDITGQKIFTLVDKEQISGFYEVSFENSVLPSGVYFYRLIAGQFVDFKKMILSK